MACQLNPNTYSLMFRFPLEDGAKLKTLADAAGVTLSKYVADMVSKHVGDRDLTEDERKWFDEHLEMNKARRARADKLTKSGYFKHRRRGRPRKPGPRKGWKKNGKILKQA